MRDARVAEQMGALGHAWELYTQALALLPAGLPQAEKISARMDDLRAKAERVVKASPQAESEPREEGRWAKWLSSLGPIGLLLAGMGKLKTVFSALAFLGVYWAAYGWKFALGIVVSIYVHEMGHVAAFRRNGIAVSAPMFIPGLGAFVRGARSADTPGKNARISLAGPLWGLGAALVALVFGMYYQSQVMIAIASTGAWINLLNLIPVAIFDGAGAFRALGRSQRGTIAGAAALLFWVTGNFLLLIIAAASIFRVFTHDLPEQPDNGVLIQFVSLMAALSLTVWMLKGS